MEYSAFIKRLSKNVITLSNTNPINNIKTVLSYEEKTNGAFISKEFRWSEDKSTWSDWEILTQESIRTIQPTSTPNTVYIQFKYTKLNNFSADVYKITLNYSDVVVSSDADTTPLGFVPVPSGLPTQPSQLTDANLLNGQNGTYYLNRVNHTGTQPISTIDGLARQLYNLSNGIQVANQYYGTLQGEITVIDGSIYYLTTSSVIQDSSIVYLFNYNAIQDASIAIASASGSNAWNGLTKTDNSIGLGGSLLYESTIALDNFNLILTSGTGKLKYGGDYGASSVEDRWIPDWGWIQSYVDASVENAAGLWTESGTSQIYYDGSVGIGTSDPSALLHVDDGDILLEYTNPTYRALKLHDKSGSHIHRLTSAGSAGGNFVFSTNGFYSGASS